jgi:hypothetical protein
MEEVIRIGDDGEFGILTRAKSAHRGICVVLFNAGVIHRSGPQRVHVELARRLSASGFDVFRFDLPGIGDAAMASDRSPHEVVERVFDLLMARTGSSGLVVGGICSAADMGWRVALEDERVRGLLLIDPMAVKGRWYRVGRVQLAMRSPLWQWPAKLLRRLRAGHDMSSAGAGANEPAIEDYRDWPSPDEFRRQAGEMLARGVRILALYTGGVADYMLHARQIDETFGEHRAHPRLQVRFDPALDHILFAASDRRRVVEEIAGWVERFESSPRPATATRRSDPDSLRPVQA